jgi:hypothetical protein
MNENKFSGRGTSSADMKAVIGSIQKNDLKRDLAEVENDFKKKIFDQGPNKKFKGECRSLSRRFLRQFSLTFLFQLLILHTANFLVSKYHQKQYCFRILFPNILLLY